MPLLLTEPGWVSADTKTYLYLDPGHLLSQAWSMWDPTVGLGTVTHQRIGFLWPMGPFYWLCELAGLPDWASQRLWWGTIMFSAGAGVIYLLRSLGWRGAGVASAAFIYALSPFVLTLVARLSGILLPFAGLPWLLAFTIQAVRHRGWRYPALFALAVATFGSVNVTALVLVLLAPALWLPYAIVTGEASRSQVLRACAKMGLLTVPVSAWWIAGLSVQRTNGIEILKYTETPAVVAGTSVSHEVLRGLGYWFFYGEDRLGPWIEPSDLYTQLEPVLLVTYLVPLLGLLGASVAAWRHRAYFVALVLVGTALAVGAYPWNDNPPFGSLVQRFQATDAGLALRSLPRAVPLVALGLSVLAGAGVSSVARRWPRRSVPLAGAVVAVAILALPPLWLGQFVPDNLRRREEVPDYWREAAAHLDERDDGTRVLVVPGADFASYRWGNTVDPILPGLMRRPSVQRELAPYGSPASASMLNAFDLRLQERIAEPDEIAPIARLLRAGDVLTINDWQYERFNIPRPRNLWDLVSRAPGLGQPVEFGPGQPNRPDGDLELDDELLFLTDPSVPDPSELVVLPVDDPIPVVSTHAATQPLVVAGDATGLVDAASAGLIDGTELIRFSASLDEAAIRDAVDQPGATLLLTDSNRLRGERWSNLRHNRGFTETVDGGVLDVDLKDQRLPVFPEAGTETMSVAVRSGAISAEATSYGNNIAYSPHERPQMAVDGDASTAWRTAAFEDARGERLELSLAEPTTADRIRVQQPPGAVSRHITRVRLRFDGGEPLDVDLTEISLGAPGEVVTFSERTFSTLTVEIVADTSGELPRYSGQTSVGFSEIEIGAVPNATDLGDEAVRLPTDLLDAAGTASLDRPLAVTLTRQRQDPSDITRVDEEAGLARLFELPTERTFAVSGTARLSPRADPDRTDDGQAPVVDALLGRPHDDAVPWVRANGDLSGAITTPAAAFDGDPATAWTTVRTRPDNSWVEVVLPAPTTIDQLPLTVRADGLHSVPTEVELWVDGAPVGRFDVDPVEDGRRQNDTAEVDLDIPEVTGSRFRLKITDVRAVTTHDWIADRLVPQPAAIAEIGLPGPTVAPLPGTFDSGCRDDLLAVADEPVPVRITGSMDDALAGRPLTLEACGTAAAGVTLGAGENRVESVAGLDSGLDLDQLVLRSAAGGAAAVSDDGPLLDAAADGDGDADATAAAPEVEILDEDLDSVRVRVSGATPGEPFWLVLGQSFNPGWVAQVDGGDTPTGQLVDGFANGWLVDAPDGSFEVNLRFTPQKRVDAALWVSGLAALLCLGLAVRRPARAALVVSAAPAPFSIAAVSRYGGRRPGAVAAVGALVGGLILGWTFAGPAVGVVTAVAAGLSARHAGMRRWILAASCGCFSLAVAYVLYVTLRHSPLPSFDWPYEMRRAHPLGWLAVLLLVVDAAVNRLWHRRGKT